MKFNLGAIARIGCIFGNHDLTVWRKCPPERVPMGEGETMVISGNERHCKRPGCTHAEYKRVRATKPRAPRKHDDAAVKVPSTAPGVQVGGGVAPEPVVTHLPGGGTLMSWAEPLAVSAIETRPGGGAVLSGDAK